MARAWRLPAAKSSFGLEGLQRNEDDFNILLK